MYCVKCGQQIADESVFCNRCGAKSVNSGESGQPTQSVNIQPTYAEAKRDYSGVQTDRSFLKLIVLSILTMGVYGISFWWRYVTDLNKVCTDKGKSPNWILVLIFASLTFGIYSVYWYCKQLNRIQKNGEMHGVHISPGGGFVLLLSVFVVSCFFLDIFLIYAFSIEASFATSLSVLVSLSLVNFIMIRNLNQLATRVVQSNR